jgi:hypothetical protein
VSDYTEMLVAYDDEPDHALSSLAPSRLQPELSAAEAELDRAREDPDDEAYLTALNHVTALRDEEARRKTQVPLHCRLSP